LAVRALAGAAAFPLLLVRAMRQVELVASEVQLAQAAAAVAVAAAALLSSAAARPE
jgi:hypothetical protein